MNSMKLLVALCIVTIASVSFAADDPSIKGQLRLNIKTAMGNHISGNLVGGKYVIYDAVKGELKRLELKELHNGVVKKGDFYVSCADFVDSTGKLYDLDFLVSNDANGIRVIQSLVHSVEGKKRKYHVEG